MKSFLVVFCHHATKELKQKQSATRQDMVDKYKFSIEFILKIHNLQVNETHDKLNPVGLRRKDKNRTHKEIL